MEAVEVLARSVDLGSASRDGLQELGASMERVIFSAGEHVYRQGTVADYVFLIEFGSVRIASEQGEGEAAFVAEVGPHELLGEMSALAGRPRTTNATATQETAAWKIPPEPLRELLMSEPEVMFGMMRSAMALVLEKDLSVVLSRSQASELRRAVDLERKAAEQLRVGTQARDERVAMMAHDIRSPVTVIQGSVELLRQYGDEMDADKRERLLHAIYNQAMGLLDLVNDALQVTSIEAGTIRYEVAPFDVAALALRMVEDLRNADEALNLIVTAPEGLPKGLGDERHHWRILFNLLSNAIRFSPEGAPIEVRVSSDVEILRVDVIDRGVGIAAEDIATVFEKYGVVDRPDAPNDGTGLGLYICRSMIEAQGGKLWVESEPGNGSTFSYTLPVARD